MAGSSFSMPAPNLVEQFGGALELTTKGIWNMGVSATAGLAGLINTAIGGSDVGAYTIQSIIKGGSLAPTSDSARYVASGLQSFGAAFEGFKTETGDYYNDRYGAFAGALGTAAPEALMLLAPKGLSTTVRGLAEGSAFAGALSKLEGINKNPFLVDGPTGGYGANTSSLTIASNPATGNPAAIARGMGELNSRQLAALDQLPEFGSNTIVHKSFGQTDLSALTAATGDEFAMFSTGGRRLIYRGDATSVPITPEIAQGLAEQGWRWSSHVHPGFDTGVLRSSLGDQAVLRAMGGNQSAIYNSMGQRSIFTPVGDSLNGWMPW